MRRFVMTGPLLSFVDQPASWELTSRCVVVRGWAFARDGRPLRALRMDVGDQVLPGVLGFPRPDVKAAVPEAPGDDTGFEIRGVLPTGNRRIRIEAQLADESWHLIFERTVTVPQRWKPRWWGQGDWEELMFFQMPSHAVHAPTLVESERFPAAIAPIAQRPHLAIVTPAYNHASFLPETMRSVLEQATPIDYVVQDGGSTDGSAALIEQEARRTASRSSREPRLVAWASERDRGQADAIAKGFARTVGRPNDVMAWINSDDFYLPGALAYVADYFARHPTVDVLYGHRVVVDEASREVGRWFLPRHDPEVLRLNDFVPQETLFWRRRVWDRVGGIDTSFKFAMDWDLLLRFQEAGARIVRVPYFLACFRVHAAQKTAAQMHSTGQEEITRLRERSFQRPFPPTELETNPALLRYLRRSALLEQLWQGGWRVRI